MKRILTGLGLTLLSSVQLLGCAADATSDDDCLPGDIDCAGPSADGKADGFDYKNDPTRMSQHLQYSLAMLPKKGELKTPTWKAQFPDAVGHVPVAWADTYWPTSEGSHNARWQGASVKSPLEKYDAAFNNVAGCATQPAQCGTGIKAKWDQYFACAGPAAKWQSTTFQGAGDMHDGVDNNGDGKIDECYGDKDADGIAGWWGTCHAWTPASLLMPEPQHAVTMNGQTFEVADIKALTQNIFDSTSAVMLGGRCNSMTIDHDVHGSANDDCRDVNPGALHVIMTNFLGISQLPLIEDRTANYEVWNQPVVGYEITKQTKVTAKAANTCVGNGTGATWTYNTKAKDLYEVGMTVTYIVEGQASKTPIGFANNKSTDDYHYILEVGADGKVIGGRFCSDSEDSHIDFLWSPTGSYQPSNPYVNASKVKELIAKSVASTTSGGGTGTAKVFTATPNASIPDNSTTGVSVDVTATGVTGTPALTVSVDITHTYSGDLTLTLLKDGHAVKTLRADTGGSADNIVESYNVGADLVGSTPNGKWTLKVVDDAAQDVGKVNTVKLSFE